MRVALFLRRDRHWRTRTLPCRTASSYGRSKAPARPMMEGCQDAWDARAWFRVRCRKGKRRLAFSVHAGASYDTDTSNANNPNQLSRVCQRDFRDFFVRSFRGRPGRRSNREKASISAAWNTTILPSGTGRNRPSPVNWWTRPTETPSRLATSLAVKNLPLIAIDMVP